MALQAPPAGHVCQGGWYPALTASRLCHTAAHAPLLWSAPCEEQGGLRRRRGLTGAAPAADKV